MNWLGKEVKILVWYNGKQWSKVWSFKWNRISRMKELKVFDQEDEMIKYKGFRIKKLQNGISKAKFSNYKPF